MDGRKMHIDGYTFSITAIRLDDGYYATTVVENSGQDKLRGAAAGKYEPQLRHATMTEALDAGELIIRARIRRRPR
jgi:hypothetical protein